jgi:hypothetical protein
VPKLSINFVEILSHASCNIEEQNKALQSSLIIIMIMGRDGSVGISTRYGLAGPGIASRWGARYYLPVQTGPGVHPASYIWVPGLFHGGKAAGAWC